jgi:hypothetical protein
LPYTEAEKILSADYFPPASRGDIYRIIASGVRTIVLIDGVFHSTRSVWQREILDALGDGIEVLGASSMGALRAAELHPFGMAGHGTIFEWYKNGLIEGDDEVAPLPRPGGARVLRAIRAAGQYPQNASKCGGRPVFDR